MAFAKQRLLPTLVWCITFVCGGAAYADDSTSPADVSATQQDHLPEILVTARRRSENIQSVPVTITAITGDQLREFGVRSVDDLREVAPGLNISGLRRDQANFYLRGQGPGVLTTGQRNFTSVATYFAEVPAVLAGPGNLYDLESVQVLKGPQGTLFGRNTTGGAVLFQPQRPVFNDEAYVQGTYGNYNYGEAEVMGNWAITPDTVALRVVGQLSTRDGYTKSVLSGQKLDGRAYGAARVSLLVKTGPVESLTIGDFREQHNTSGSQIIRALNPGAPLGSVPVSPALAPLLGAPPGTKIPIRAGGVVSIACLRAALPGCPTGRFGGAVAAFQAAYNGGNFADPANSGFALIGTTPAFVAAMAQQPLLGPRQTQVPQDVHKKVRDAGITNKTLFTLNDDITLVNIVGFRSHRENEAQNYSGTPLPFLLNVQVFDQPWSIGTNQFTEEFQIQGRAPSAKLKYIAGYYHEHSDPGMPYQEVEGYNAGTTFSDRVSSNHDDSDSVFGHVEWNPIDLVGIAGGLRETWDDRQAQLSIYNSIVQIPANCTQVDTTGTKTCPVASDVRFHALTYDATVQIHPASDVLVYASYRHGYKSGGTTLPAPPSLIVFNPEYVNEIEVGLKADWDIGMPLRTNVAYFHDNYNNIQTPNSIAYQPTPTAQVMALNIIENNVRAHVQGFEFEGTIVPVHSVKLNAFASYTDAHDLQTIPGVTIQGRQLAYTPKWKYGMNGIYTLPIPEQYGEVMAAVDWTWQDAVNTHLVPGLVPTNPGYGLLNGRIAWNNILGKGIDLSLWATNITDKVYVLGGYPVESLGFDAVFYGEPRMYGGTVKVHFGGH